MNIRNLHNRINRALSKFEFIQIEGPAHSPDLKDGISSAFIYRDANVYYKSLISNFNIKLSEHSNKADTISKEMNLIHVTLSNSVYFDTIDSHDYNFHETRKDVHCNLKQLSKQIGTGHLQKEYGVSNSDLAKLLVRIFGKCKFYLYLEKKKSKVVPEDGEVRDKSELSVKQYLLVIEYLGIRELLQNHGLKNKEIAKILTILPQYQVSTLNNDLSKQVRELETSKNLKKVLDVLGDIDIIKSRANAALKKQPLK